MCWWSSAAALIGVVMLGAAQTPPKPRDVPPFLDEFQPGKPRDLPPFLDEFSARNEPPILKQDVQFPSAVGAVRGFWARVQRAEPLPALLLVYDAEPPAWMATNASQLASIGYAALAVKLRRGERGAGVDEASVAQLAAAVRWLRAQPDVAPDRIGVVGWGWSGTQALALAGTTAVQACVVCDTPLPRDAGIINGLRGTALLAVYGEQGMPDEVEMVELRCHRRRPCRFHIGVGAPAGFLGPPESKAYRHDAAEDAWVAIYNFLEKYVEDARPAEVVARPAKSALTIADMMRAVNDPTGVRGALSKALETEPKSARQWGQVRAHAALIAELGAWLRTQPPPKGTTGHWQEQAQAFSAAAAAIVEAAERRDHAAARQRLVQLAGQCAACHNEHR